FPKSSRRIPQLLSPRFQSLTVDKHEAVLEGVVAFFDDLLPELRLLPVLDPTVVARPGPLRDGTLSASAAPFHHFEGRRTNVTAICAAVSQGRSVTLVVVLEQRESAGLEELPDLSNTSPPRRCLDPLCARLAPVTKVQRT